MKPSFPAKVEERSVCCPKCGRGYRLEEGYIPEHRVKKLSTRTTIICKGSNTHAD